MSLAMILAKAARRAAREALKKYKAAQKGNSPKVKKLMKKKGSAKDVKPVRGELTGRKKPKMTTRTKADMVRDQYGKDSISGEDMSKRKVKPKVEKVSKKEQKKILDRAHSKASSFKPNLNVTKLLDKKVKPKRVKKKAVTRKKKKK